MSIKIALAGNPNCGKTTMFNALTGSNQYVGNWPGVTVEKKEGKLKGQKDVIITDLPGIYSLSPYTSEEVVSRDYLAGSEPSAVLNIVDATNIERNLYLTTQIMELGKPVVLALNMMDVLKKNGDVIDTKKLSEKLGCKIIETSALKGTGIQEAAQNAINAAENKKPAVVAKFSADVEKAIDEMMAVVPSSVAENLKRWYAIKLIERDSVVLENLKLSDSDRAKAESIAVSLETKLDDDTESIITNERYNYITDLLKGCLKKSGSKLTTSDKIDRIVTNRFLGIPIFLCVMWFVYYLSISTVGTFMTDWTNDTLFGEWLQGGVEGFLTNAGANPVLIDCIVNGIIGGVGSVLGFVPQMAVLFFLLSIVEDVGYMVRIAFVMDRLFRKFGLSGKSFIPLLIGTGCGVPGIMASRTIENDNDRRMTIFTTTWIPCGAKLPVIAMIAAILATKLSGTNGGWVAPLMYVIGVGMVLISAVILKKTKYFHGKAAPFVMELPQYHIPAAKTVLMHTWERLRGFIIKAGTVLFLACLVMWFLSSYGFVNKANPDARNSGSFGLTSAIIDEATEENGELEFADASEYSIMATVGNGLRYIFYPLGFGNKEGGWQAAASTISGFTAKEAIASTMGVLAGADEADIDAMAEAGDVADIIGGDEEAEGEEAEDAEGEEEEGNAMNAINAIGEWFPTAIAAFAFLLFNLLDSPCLAAIATMANELKSRKWFWFAILFQNLSAYVVTFIFYQFGMFFVHHGTASYANGASIGGFVVAIILTIAILVALFRPNPYDKKNAVRMGDDENRKAV
jgi:ferrous iron transport protein B